MPYTVNSDKFVARRSVPVSITPTIGDSTLMNR